MNVWWIICKFVPKNWIIMEIRFAQNRDIPRIHQLLTQVNNVHAKGRPDLFKSGNRKYTDEQLRQIIANVEHSPIFVLVDDNDMVLGYCFGIVEQFINDNNRGASTSHAGSTIMWWTMPAATDSTTSRSTCGNATLAQGHFMTTAA